MNITSYRPSIYARARRIEAEANAAQAAGSTLQMFTRPAVIAGVAFEPTQGAGIFPATPATNTTLASSLGLGPVAAGAAV